MGLVETWRERYDEGLCGADAAVSDPIYPDQISTACLLLRSLRTSGCTHPCTQPNVPATPPGARSLDQAQLFAAFILEQLPHHQHVGAAIRYAPQLQYIGTIGTDMPAAPHDFGSSVRVQF